MTKPRPFTFPHLRPKRSKYGNTKVEHAGMKFDSVLEKDRFLFLDDLRKQGKIAGLQHQVEYDLVVNEVLVCKITPDFRYWVGKEMRLVIEDTKGILTDSFRIKAKLFKAIHGKEIKIVTRENVTAMP